MDTIDKTNKINAPLSLPSIALVDIKFLCNPSRSDIEATKAINQAFSVVGIKVIDNIIVADNNFYSFAENGRLEASILSDRSIMENSIKDRMTAAREQANEQRSQSVGRQVEKATVLVK